MPVQSRQIISHHEFLMYSPPILRSWRPSALTDTAKSFRSDSHVQSIVHGEAMNPQFQLAFSDAVTQFAQSKDVDTFVQALAAAAQ